MSLPQVVSREEWLTARRQLLDEEKELTRRRDALNAERRRLPMVEVVKPYTFTGPGGEATLLDLFDGCRQLIVGHFMFDPSWEDGCSSCSAGADEISNGLLAHLRARDTTLVQVSRAPLEKLERYKARKGWTFPWYSSHGSDFNYDFHVTLDESVAPLEYLLELRPRRGDDRRLLLLPRPDCARPAGGLGAAEGSRCERPRRDPRLLRLTRRAGPVSGPAGARRNPATGCARRVPSSAPARRRRR